MGRYHFFLKRSLLYIPGAPPEGRATLRVGERILIDQFMQEAVYALDASRPLVHSPANSAKRIVWRASGAQPSPRQDDQLEVSPAGAVPNASPTGEPSQNPSDTGDSIGPGTAMSSIKSRARSVEPVRVATAASPAEHCEQALRDKCPENSGGRGL
eukprot:3504610-Pyramimonas_sp.AAC.1